MFKLSKQVTRLAFVMIAGVLFVAASGCSPQIKEGWVVSHQFVPKHEEDAPDIVIDDITIPGGTYTVPDKWYIKFRKKDESGEWVYRTLEVTKTEHDQYKKGDWIEFR